MCRLPRFHELTPFRRAGHAATGRCRSSLLHRLDMKLDQIGDELSSRRSRWNHHHRDVDAVAEPLDRGSVDEVPDPPVTVAADHHQAGSVPASEYLL